VLLRNPRADLTHDLLDVHMVVALGLLRLLRSAAVRSAAILSTASAMEMAVAAVAVRLRRMVGRHSQ
jgi:hypothetical protein